MDGPHNGDGDEDSLMGMRYDVEVRGLREYMLALKSLDERSLRREATTSLKRAGRMDVAPAISAAIAGAVEKPNSHRGPAGKRGRGGPLEKSVKALVAKRRSGELVAVRVLPRAYWAGWFVRGTAAHVIRAKNAKALAVAGGFYSEVQHPGAKPHNVIGPAARGKAPAVQRRLRDDLFRHLVASSRR